MKILNMPALALVSLLVAAPAAHAQGPALYSGEKATELAGFPAVTYFAAGRKDAPLIVFVPGAHHNGRISYGGHANSDPEDFLAHWLHAKEFNFLAVSYPIETKSGLMPDVRPAFSAQDWGRQIAAAVVGVVDENALEGKIYLATWSMAGKAMQPAHAALREVGYPVEGVFSLAATPGIPAINGMTRELETSASGNADRTSSYQGWYDQIAANAEGGAVSIPEDIFFEDYVGHISVNLQGFGQIYRDGKIEIDHMAQATDYGALKFEDHPLVVTLMGDDRADARHAIGDQAYWNLYNTNTLFAMLMNEKGALAKLSEEEWKAVVELAAATDEDLSVDVGGNHFFFVGEKGAKSTADGIAEGIARLSDWKVKIDELLEP